MTICWGPQLNFLMMLILKFIFLLNTSSIKSTSDWLLILVSYSEELNCRIFVCGVSVKDVLGIILLADWQ